MKKLISVVLSTTCLLCSTQTTASSSGKSPWSAIDESSIPAGGKRLIVPQKYLTYRLNGTALKDQLFGAPHEDLVTINESTSIVSIPLPNGEIQSFRVVESPVMAPELAAAYPQMKTFSVKGIDDPYANGKLDWVESGFHAMIRTVNGDFFIDPFQAGNTSDYISYYVSDLKKDHPAYYLKEELAESTDELVASKAAKTSSPGVCVGSTRYNYRLAVCITSGGCFDLTGIENNAPVATVLSAAVTVVNQVDGILESELAIRLTLVPTVTLTIFTNEATDPFEVADGIDNVTKCHTILTNTIGTANFDIGHLFSAEIGGVGTLASVCDPNTKGKARSFAQTSYPKVFTHEFGHQFNANHSFNLPGIQRVPSAAVEPGVGFTIMSYNANAILYYHAHNYDEIVNFSRNTISCHTGTATGNQPPVVTGSGNYVIPKATAFILEGSATDPDGDALTYSWEETDVASADGDWNSGNKPFFRSYAPVTIPRRSFPNNTVVLSGNYTATQGEYIPQSAQVLNFRLTARDNKANGGGVCYANNTVTVDASGPFQLTVPSQTGIVWPSGVSRAVYWDENSTSLAPVSCVSVEIWISLDAGNTYQSLIKTLNDGKEGVLLPQVSTTVTTCRIRITAVNNIFFDVSDNNFTLLPYDPTVPPIEPYGPFGLGRMGLTAAPNPFKDQVEIGADHLNKDFPTLLSVRDILGKEVFSISYAERKMLKETIDLSEFDSGVYFIHVNNDLQKSVIRVVKN